MNEITGRIIGAAIETHRFLGGPGLLEKVYEEAFAIELTLCGFQVQRQIYAPILYKGQKLEAPLIIDLLIDQEIIIECKATEKYNTIYETQLLTYLRVTEKPLGLVINFGEKYVRDGIHRVVNKT
jgi:GxxExxY protein